MKHRKITSDGQAECEVRPEQTRFRVLRIGEWRIHHGALGSGITAGVWGQVTECELTKDGTRFYVRESFERHNASSQERWRWKTEGAVSRNRWTLELVLAVGKPYDPPWHEVEEAVRYGDPLGRPVVPNERFTVRWAIAQLEKGMRP